MKSEITGRWIRILHCSNNCGWFANHILLEHLQVCPYCGSYTTFSVGRIKYKVVKLKF